MSELPHNAELAQLVEPAPCKRKVKGSSPIFGSILQRLTPVGRGMVLKAISHVTMTSEFESLSLRHLLN